MRINCDFTKIGTLDNGLTLLVCTRAGCGKTVKVRGERCNAICRVQPEGFEVERPTAATLPCSHRGEATGDEVGCGCGNEGTIRVFRCDVFDLCTIPSTGKTNYVAEKKVACCLGCDRREPPPL